MLADAGAWALGLTVADAARYDFVLARIAVTRLAAVVLLAVVVQWIAGTVVDLYRGRHRVGSFEEVAGLLFAAVCATIIVQVVDILLSQRAVPFSVPLPGGIMSFAMMAGARYSWRAALERRMLPGSAAERLLVFGAGDGSYQLLRSMLRDPGSAYFPVGLLDDDPRKQHLRLMGVPVLGGRERLAAVAAELNVSTLLVAIPSADADLLRDLTTAAEDVGLTVKVLPPVADLLSGRVTVRDIRDVDVKDLLGRRPVRTDVDAIAGYLTGRRVLVTGAGGSIGAELCRQIHRYSPAQLLMLDRDESALHAVQLSIFGRALLDSPDVVLADIRDIAHLDRLFEDRRPHVVFHAAALKHLPLLEQYPGEAIKTNVWGTLAVLEASAAAGVDRFVNISTDKAADPTSVLGHSKRIAERLTAHAAQFTGGVFLSVRFGNVLGSRGSVLTVFTEQVAAGGPVTVTHPDVTRYFMTVQEAVELVIQAGAIGRGGEALVLDMGTPVRIADVARRLADESPTQIEVIYTGLRPGEKLHEDLFAAGERDERPMHPMISQVRVPPLDPVSALELDPWAKHAEMLTALGYYGRCEDVAVVDINGRRFPRQRVG